MKKKFQEFIDEYFIFAPWRGVILVTLLIYLLGLVTNLVWFANNCFDYISLKDNPNVAWELEVGSTSASYDTETIPDLGYPYSAYPSNFDERYTFTAVTTWFYKGDPTVDVYRIAFFKPLSNYGLVCNLDYKESLTRKVSEQSSLFLKNFLWFLLLICVWINIKAYHEFKSTSYIYSEEEFNRDPIGSAIKIKEHFEPLTLYSYLENVPPAFFLAFAWRTLWIVYTLLDQLTTNLFIF